MTHWSNFKRFQSVLLLFFLPDIFLQFLIFFCLPLVMILGWIEKFPTRYPNFGFRVLERDIFSAFIASKLFFALMTLSKQNLVKKVKLTEFCDQNNPKYNTVQKGAGEAGFERGQRFKWRTELSQSFEKEREKSQVRE